MSKKDKENKNLEYWRKREAEWEREYQRDMAKYEREIHQIYKDLMDDMQAEIDGWYAKFAKQEGLSMADAQIKLSKADQDYYARRAREMCELAEIDMKANNRDHADVYFSDLANDEMRIYNAKMKISRMKALKSMLNLETMRATGQIDQKMHDILIKEAEDKLRKEAKILGPTVLGAIDRIPTIVRASFHGATFSKRLWGSHQDTMKKDLQKILARGLIMGESPERFRKQIEKDLQIEGAKAKKAAKRLLRTEFARVQTQAQAAAFEEIGIEEFQFVTAAGCCDDCQANDGKIFKLKKGETGGNLPPMHPHCRCAIAPYLDRKEYDQWLDSYKDHGMTFEEWKAKDQKPVETEPTIEPIKADDQIEVKSFGELAQKMSDLYRIEIDPEVIEKGSFDGVKQFCDGIETAIQRFPEIKNVINRIAFNPQLIQVHGAAEFDYRTEKHGLNPAIFSDDLMIKGYNAHESKGGLGVPKNVKETAIHECGHAMEWLLDKKKYPEAWEAKHEHARGKDVHKLIMDAAKAIRKTNDGKTNGRNKTAQELLRGISLYATNGGDHEAFAEAFCDAVVNGKRANAFSKEIFASVDKKYSELCRNSKASKHNPTPMKKSELIDSKVASKKGNKSSPPGGALRYTTKYVYIRNKQEYAIMKSKLNTYYDEAWAEKRIITKYIGDYVYVIEVFGFDDYGVLSRRKIPSAGRKRKK